MIVQIIVFFFLLVFSYSISKIYCEVFVYTMKVRESDCFLFCCFFFFSTSGCRRGGAPQREFDAFRFFFKQKKSNIFCEILMLSKHSINNCEKFFVSLSCSIWESGGGTRRESLDFSKYFNNFYYFVDRPKEHYEWCMG